MLYFLIIRMSHLTKILFSKALILFFLLNELFFSGLKEFELFKFMFIHVFLVYILSFLVSHFALLLLLQC